MGGVSVDNVEEGRLAVGVVLDLEALLGEFGDELFDALGLMDLDQAGTAAAGILVGLGDLLGKSATILCTLSLGGLCIEEVEVDVGRREVAQVGLVLEVLDGLIVAVTDDDEEGG